MRAKGITYSTGFVVHGKNSLPEFDPDRVRRELEIIRDDLHCNAVRVIGGDPERLEFAAAHAAGLGLEVWFSPYPLESTTDEMLALFADCADRAERIRARGAEVVFVTGAELCLMDRGFLPGDTQEERIGLLLNRRDRLAELLPGVVAGVNDFLGEAVALVRDRFGGKVAYAAVPLENVDWEPFDFVGLDLYRSAEIADQYADGIRRLVSQGKPVAITEFGTSAFRGAGDLGGRILEAVDYDKETGAPIGVNGDRDRDEEGQATYLLELLETFDTGGVDSAFVFLFALDDFPHRPDGDPRDDIDMASPGVVKVYEDRLGEAYPDMPWEPKAAFGAVAGFYGG
ncbi:hypothetical protein [Umezawaea sp. Da 62-37]|uniref:hypothetical protein n=1 Tax=Umezawaea sp. Da 62-37 TaxID=3075927 RepID=UPI0028F6CEC9|nr:hypothetical protein [Umezawaea sp. Da 62-37]WNV88054.1 hypothetical protein RM788_07130 [Umezawaea sp. Da 62-37]